MTRCLDDCFLFATDDPDQAANLVVDIVANRLPHHFALDPTWAVQGRRVLELDGTREGNGTKER